MELMMDIFEAKGTIGLGDAMYYMNVAYNYANEYNKPVELRIYWQHDQNYNYHFEDPETIIEKANYFQQFYYRTDLVKLTHIFNYDIESNELLSRYRMLLNGERCIIWSIKHIHDHLNGSKRFRSPRWFFDPKFQRPSVENKVVVWRSKFNAEAPRPWKRFNDGDVIKLLETFGFNIIELDYRTPIREAMWHISTCEFCVGYDGMWHHVAQNFFKPMYIFSNNILTALHTPGAIWYGGHKKNRYREFFMEFDIPKQQSQRTVQKFNAFFKGKSNIISNHEMLFGVAKEYENRMMKESNYDRS